MIPTTIWMIHMKASSSLGGVTCSAIGLRMLLVLVNLIIMIKIQRLNSLNIPWLWIFSGRDAIWVAKRAKLVAIEADIKTSTPVTVQQGNWYSAVCNTAYWMKVACCERNSCWNGYAIIWSVSQHELWKMLEMPYLSVPITRGLFINGEVARSWLMLEAKSNGMRASVNGVAAECHGLSYESAYESKIVLNESHRDLNILYLQFWCFLYLHFILIDQLRHSRAGLSRGELRSCCHSICNFPNYHDRRINWTSLVIFVFWNQLDFIFKSHHEGFNW
jgi:hypothetical protein